MESKNKYLPPQMSEIVNSLENEELWSAVTIRLKQTEPEDDEVLGIKKFLEKNNFDRGRLKIFLEEASMEIDARKMKKEKKSSKSLWYKVAAAVVLLLAVSTYFLFENTNQGEELYAKYYEKELGFPVTLSTDHDKKFNESMNLFRNEEYERSLSGFQELLRTNSENDTLRYFIGVCFMEMNEPKKALKTFSFDFKNSLFKEKVEFRKALIYLKIEEYDKVRQLLLDIVNNPDHAYFTVSNKILKEPVFN
ncbi:MAG: hypothetical protein WDZ35_07335 [Crocinitomicaceae bacterium]